ncbi:ubiquitin C-terminal hydrolase 12-like isoform X2 [Cornus florida]|uniref:ubiquitin C-terminal hydrolase 12-like isoform X2 n=1 Tax=Cornus florida TaxID=4283 RepID=UPI00289FF54C|nr:ubiquitin C-terminal hydrolase 12-like isoform X2 [Cornus florida]XP_059653036.1 ubiquitin C-terminal hydrolase 12-like isoform X2 [Cornus florida]
MSTNIIDAAEIKRTLRDVQPSHFIFKIESFSLLLETKTENYESDVFEAGGYNWKLSLYPNGNSKRNGKDHISLYLVIDNPSCGLEVNVNFKLFVYDHIHDMYLTIEDAEPVKRFHFSKTECGFDKFLSHEDFQNPWNGYLVDDNCVFGAEVFVMKYPGKVECLSMTSFCLVRMFTPGRLDFQH